MNVPISTVSIGWNDKVLITVNDSRLHKDVFKQSAVDSLSSLKYFQIMILICISLLELESVLPGVFNANDDKWTSQ